MGYAEYPVAAAELNVLQKDCPEYPGYYTAAIGAAQEPVLIQVNSGESNIYHLIWQFHRQKLLSLHECPGAAKLHIVVQRLICLCSEHSK